jgi:carboxypeptidase C (cathepsin A)
MHSHSSRTSPGHRGSRIPTLLTPAAFLGLLALATPAMAQVNAYAAVSQDPTGTQVTLPLESAVTTQHTVTIRGQRVPYTATAGTLPVYDTEGKAVAAVFYVYYERSDVTDKVNRPLTFSFNGGPGSSSVWMHMGYTSPRRLNIDDEGNPIRPFGVHENPYSILDATDIVFVDPVNVGLSRMVDGADRTQFFGVNQDVAYLAAWIELFVNRQDRWLSPKFLIGESYGTTRVSGLSRRLQSAHKMFMNGVVLVSPTGLGGTKDIPSSALQLPHYAATAWYFGKLPPDLQSRDLDEILPEVEAFALDEYAPALARGGFLDEAERREMARRVARYAGVSPTFVDNLNLQIPIGHWRKELLRDQRLTVGRLDSRYQGVDADAGGITYDYDPAMSSWNHSFTPAMKSYLKGTLKYETDLEYVTIGGNVSPWDRTNDTTGEDLRRAMAENPFLKTMIQSGYYDGGTDYFSAKVLMWQMDRSGQLRDRFRFRTYRSGHMMYLRDEDLATSNQDIRDFIAWSIPEDGVPALWGRRVPVAAGGGGER